MSNDPTPPASSSEPEAQRILARAAELEATIGNHFTTELGIAFGAFTATIVAMEGMQDASPAVTWSLLAGAFACGILSLRAARPSESVAATSPANAR